MAVWIHGLLKLGVPKKNSSELNTKTILPANDGDELIARDSVEQQLTT